MREGIDLLSRRRPDVVRLLRRDLSATIEQARHTLNVVNDIHWSVNEILAAFYETPELHAARFSFGPDLAIASWRGSAVYSSRSAESQELAAIRASDPHGTSVTMRQSMATILQCRFGVPVPRWTQLDLPEAEGPDSADLRAKSYCPNTHPGLDNTDGKDLALTVKMSLKEGQCVGRAHATDSSGPSSGRNSEVALRLARALQDRGVSAWLDKTELRIGDGIRRRLDRGLRSSRFAAVVFSEAWFSKGRPQYELDGIDTLTGGGQQNLCTSGTALIMMPSRR